MSTPSTSGVVAGRLGKLELESNFSDLHAPLDRHEAEVAADRCYFCHDAPCMTACPTSIDIPLFIRQIQTGTPEAAGKTILSDNILGGMCARVCPTETLCEESCVREEAEGRPVQIGRLQRYATDSVMARQGHPFERAARTGKTIAVVGAGPAGLACAHRLAMKGHDIVLFEGRAKAGGLNEFGIASYKSPDNFAQKEVAWLLEIGGIEVRTGQALGDGLSLSGLVDDFDAVFLSVGLGGVNALSLEGDGEITNAVDFIADLRQSADVSTLPIGRDIVVVGGGMTAIDAAVQAKLLGARSVTISYRRSQDAMGASKYEQDLATSKGVTILCNTMPVSRSDGEITLEYTSVENGRVQGTGERFTVSADQVFAAIGQTLNLNADVEIENGKIKVNEVGQTSLPNVWAGGDCATGGEDLTVTAVAEGRDAAENIHAQLMG